MKPDDLKRLQRLHRALTKVTHLTIRKRGTAEELKAAYLRVVKRARRLGWITGK